MTKLKTPTELTREVFSPDVSVDDLIWTAIVRDRQVIREALVEEIEGEKMVYNVTDTKTHRRGKEAYNRGITKRSEERRVGKECRL